MNAVLRTAPRASMASQFAARLDRLSAGFAPLPDKPAETADSTLRALWRTSNGAPVSAVSASIEAAGHALPELDEATLARLDALIDRRLRGEPLAHLTRREHFLGLELVAGPEALVPRRETELLARGAVALARAIAAERGRVSAIDACTGCGNVALAIAHHVLAARVRGADVSADAVALAGDNAMRLGLRHRVDFVVGDLLSPFAGNGDIGQVDLVTCNPPYISSGKVARMPTEIAAHEPRLAFDGGPLGVSLLLRLLQDAPSLLRPGGWLAMEIGLGQGASLARRMRRAGVWQEVREVCDDAGEVRVLLARRA